MWLQPQADCGKQRCTPVSPNVYRAMVLAAYPAIHAADPVSQVLIGALAPAGGDLKSDNANMRPLEFLRGLGCLDGKLHAVHTGALPRRSSPRSPTASPTTRTAPATRRASPTRTRTTPTSAA